MLCKMRPHWNSVIQHDWHSTKRRYLGIVMWTGRVLCESRSCTATSQGRSFPRGFEGSKILPTLWSQKCSLQNFEIINFFSLSLWYFFGSSSRQMQEALSILPHVTFPYSQPLMLKGCGKGNSGNPQILFFSIILTHQQAKKSAGGLCAYRIVK